MYSVREFVNWSVDMWLRSFDMDLCEEFGDELVERFGMTEEVPLYFTVSGAILYFGVDFGDFAEGWTELMFCIGN